MPETIEIENQWRFSSSLIENVFLFGAKRTFENYWSVYEYLDLVRTNLKESYKIINEFVHSFKEDKDFPIYEGRISSLLEEIDRLQARVYETEGIF